MNHTLISRVQTREKDSTVSPPGNLGCAHRCPGHGSCHPLQAGVSVPSPEVLMQGSCTRKPLGTAPLTSAGGAELLFPSVTEVINCEQPEKHCNPPKVQYTTENGKQEVLQARECIVSITKAYHPRIYCKAQHSKLSSAHKPLFLVAM